MKNFFHFYKKFLENGVLGWPVWKEGIIYCTPEIFWCSLGVSLRNPKSAPEISGIISLTFQIGGLGCGKWANGVSVFLVVASFSFNAWRLLYRRKEVAILNPLLPFFIHSWMPETSYHIYTGYEMCTKTRCKCTPHAIARIDLFQNCSRQLFQKGPCSRLFVFFGIAISVCEYQYINILGFKTF